MALANTRFKGFRDTDPFVTILEVSQEAQTGASVATRSVRWLAQTGARNASPTGVITAP